MDITTTVAAAGAGQADAAAVPVGPSGRAMAQPMDPGLIEGLREHLTMERRAHASYWAMAIWCAERELRGFAHFLQHESSDEQHHAGLVANYLIARGQSVSLEDLPAPPQPWESVEGLLATVFQMEADVTCSLQQLYGMAERAGDVRTTVFLDPMVQGQIEAEHLAAHMLGRVRFCQGDRAGLLVIDGELSAGKHDPASLA